MYLLRIIHKNKYAEFDHIFHVHSIHSIQVCTSLVDNLKIQHLNKLKYINIINNCNYYYTNNYMYLY